MSVTIVGLDSFISGLGVAKDSAKEVVEKAALNLALLVRRLAQGKAPKASSQLAQSITATPLAYGAQTTVEAKYGPYVEYGTGMFDPRGGHLIYSKGGGPMVWETGGHVYGAYYTRGMEAQPYFEPAIQEAEPSIEEEMAKAAGILINMAVKA